MHTRDLGLIGYGSMGRAYHRLVRTHPGLVPLVGALHIGTRGTPAGWQVLDDRDHLGSVDAVLADGSLGAVLIATPPDTHRALAHRALDAGKHVLVEKPAALTASDAHALNGHAAAAGRTLQVVSQLRRTDGSMRARERIRSGALGEIRSALVDLPLWRSDAYFHASATRSTRELWNLAYHELDLALWCLGPVGGITVTASPAPRSESRVPPFTACLEHVSGCLTTLRYSTTAYPGRAPRVSFEGLSGSLVLESGVPVLDLAPAASDVPDAGLYARQASVPPAPEDWLAPHAAQLRAFLHNPATASPSDLDDTSIRTIDLIRRLERQLPERQKT